MFATAFAAASGLILVAVLIVAVFAGRGITGIAPASVLKES